MTVTPSKPSVHRPWRKWLRRFLGIIGLLLLACGIKFVLHLLLPRDFNASGEMLPLHLSGGLQEVPFYCHTKKPKGIVILGTGDGGWSYWEENTAQHLAANGYAVGGWDCRKFADSRSYDYADLCAGFRAAWEAVQKRSFATANTPVWYGGWSTGAEQSVAAATAADRPSMLKGLLLAAPASRGRFGITTADLLGETPEGPGSFSLAEMGLQLKGLPVAQFVAGLDPLEDTSWIDGYAGPKRIILMKGMLHDMGRAGEEFQTELDQAIAWTLIPHP